MHTPDVRSLSPNNTEKQTTSTYKEYGDDFTTICTQCNKILASPGISMRISREEDVEWVDCDIDGIPHKKRNSLSHGLCRSCYNNIDAHLLSLAPMTINPRTSILSKSLSSPQFFRHFPSQSKRILIVDDNELQRRIHKRIVEHAGYACDVAADGTQALELIEKHSYSFILMDLVMSPMDGWTTTKKIRLSLLKSLGSSTSSPKIIAVTGLQVDEKLKRQCNDAGMDEVVQKPINTVVFNKIFQKHSVQSAMKLDS